MSLLQAIRDGRVVGASLLPPDEKDKKKDWVLISAIAVVIIAGMVAAFGVLSFQGIFPIELIGGRPGVLITIFSAAIMGAPAAYIAVKHWFNPPPDPADD